MNAIVEKREGKKEDKITQREISDELTIEIEKETGYGRQACYPFTDNVHVPNSKYRAIERDIVHFLRFF